LNVREGCRRLFQYWCEHTHTILYCISRKQLLSVWEKNQYFISFKNSKGINNSQRDERVFNIEESSTGIVCREIERSRLSYVYMLTPTSLSNSLSCYGCYHTRIFSLSYFYNFSRHAPIILIDPGDFHQKLSLMNWTHTHTCTH
jgi:hypothetical protein